ATNRQRPFRDPAGAASSTTQTKTRATSRTAVTKVRYPSGTPGNRDELLPPLRAPAVVSGHESAPGPAEDDAAGADQQHGQAAPEEQPPAGVVALRVVDELHRQTPALDRRAGDVHRR